MTTSHSLISKEYEPVSKNCRHVIVLFLKIDSLNFLFLRPFHLFRHEEMAEDRRTDVHEADK
jgi:hypothetical protein